MESFVPDLVDVDYVDPELINVSITPLNGAVSERGTPFYMVFLFVDNDEGTIVLTQGVELSPELARQWANKAIEMQPWIDGNDCPRDAYDRGQFDLV